MEPFTMMLGYGLVNSLSQLVVRPIADKLSAPGRQKEMLMQMEAKHALDLEAVRLNKEIELENQKDIQAYCHNFRIQEAQNQFDRQLQMWQIGNFNDKVWPLKTPFDHPSLHPQYVKGKPTPVNIFLAQTDPRSPFSSLIQPDLKNRLSNFLQTTYVNDPLLQHPCICRIGDWKDGFQDAAFINALWYGMQGQPTIVINPIQSEFGETLDLNVSIWGLGEFGTNPKTQSVLTGSFASAIGRIKKQKTELWLACGLPVESKEMIHNVNLLEQEKRMIAEGHGEFVDKLLVQYKLPIEIQTEVITEFSSEYNHLIACITGMYADIYHMIEYGAQPYMPAAINQYNKNTGSAFQIPEIAIQHYRKTLTNMVCTNYLQDKLPYTFLGVAKSLSYTPEDSMQIFQEGVGLWVNKKLDLSHEINIPTNIDECLGLLYDNATDSDRPYLEQAKDVLISMNLPEAANSLNKKISVLVSNPQQADTPRSEDIEWEVVEKETFTDVDYLKWISNNKFTAIDNNAEYAVMAFRETYFVMMFLDSNAKVICNRNLSGQCVIAKRYLFAEEKIEGTLSVFNIKKNQFISKKTLMDKKEFDSFERLGKQLDTLVNNLGNLARPNRVGDKTKASNKKSRNADEFQRQLADVFISGNYISLESEKCETASFDSIKEWITRKLPIQDAVSAHIFKTDMVDDIMLCIFFSDKECNTLIGNDYPMKRIICKKCDSDIEVFLNGLTIGTIKL